MGVLGGGRECGECYVNVKRPLYGCFFQTAGIERN